MTAVHFKSGSPEHRERMRQSAANAWADPVKRARRIEAIRNGRTERLGTQVPAWVTKCLRNEYLEWARMFDEFAAAKHVRGLIAGMRK